MNHTSFPDIFQRSQCILGEGAVIERLRRNSKFELDPNIVNSAFIYDEKKSSALSAIYRQYLDIGFKYRLPLILSTPTWRASQERIALAGYEKKDVNGDNFRFLNAIRNDYDDYSRKVIICGLMSCRGDAYNQTEALTAADAEKFHSWQATMLAKTGVDFLLAATLPALSESIGLASALAATGRPYIISFVLRPEGTMLDGTPLKDAISTIDANVYPRPLTYMANCTHASIFKTALMHHVNSSPLVRKRVTGLLANTAALKPEELDNSEALVGEKPETFGKSIADLYIKMGLKILGGCCGTDDRHINDLAKRIASHIVASKQ